jgi:DNA-binding Lrp family transcriptional regulator
MKEIELDDIDKGLINALQADFPLTRRPFADTGSSLGLGEEEVIRRINRLKEAQTIRSIGPVIDPRSLGYRSTLVAMSVPEDSLRKAADIVNRHPGVSHNYLRDDSFNVWFTLSVPPGVDLDSELKILGDEVRPEQMLNLPAVRLFKLDVFFDAKNDGQHKDVEQVAERHESTVSPDEKKVIDVLQRDLPLLSHPFDAMADGVGMTVDDFLAHCRRLKEQGVLRRFGASVRHRTVGYRRRAGSWPPTAR